MLVGTDVHDDRTNSVVVAVGVTRLAHAAVLRDGGEARDSNLYGMPRETHLRCSEAEDKGCCRSLAGCRRLLFIQGLASLLHGYPTANPYPTSRCY
eukprot:scaffold16270_cov54-Phaeocystis_antarctica.AAC.2